MWIVSYSLRYSPASSSTFFAVDNWPEELFEQFVFPVGALVGRGQSQPIGRDGHLRDLTVGRRWQVVFLIDDE